jgi:hypothetical protein
MNKSNQSISQSTNPILFIQSTTVQYSSNYEVSDCSKLVHLYQSSQSESINHDAAENASLSNPMEDVGIVATATSPEPPLSCHGSPRRRCPLQEFLGQVSGPLVHFRPTGSHSNWRGTLSSGHSTSQRSVSLLYYIILYCIPHLYSRLLSIYTGCVSSHCLLLVGTCTYL